MALRVDRMAESGQFGRVFRAGIDVAYIGCKRKVRVKPRTLRNKHCLTNLGGLIMKPAMMRRNSWLPTGGWFPTVLDEWLNTDVINSANNVAPSVNVKENQNGYVVELAAPGVKKEYCRVHVDEDHNLCVAIENKFEHKEEDKHSHYLRREFAYTNFEQKYSLPDNVDEQAISAKVEDGILSIDLPKIKREEGKTSRQIAIK